MLRVVTFTIALCALTLGVPACRMARAPQTSMQSFSLRVLTYNINASAPLTDESLRAIREANADLVCLQEVRSDAETRLRNEFRRTYPHVFSLATPGGWDGLLILSRHKLRRQRALPKTPESWFPAMAADVSTPAGDIQVLNVHLRPRVADFGGVLVGHFVVGPMHERELAAHLAMFDTDRPLLVIGDMNAADDEPAMKYMNQRGLASALAPFDSASPTFIGKYRRIPVRGRVDHIMHSRHFRATEAAVIDNRGSDHLPVTARLEWN